jgi:hypothetical protein
MKLYAYSGWVDFQIPSGNPDRGYSYGNGNHVIYMNNVNIAQFYLNDQKYIRDEQYDLNFAKEENREDR